MAHTFEHTLDEWAKNGTKSAPSSTLKSTGFVGGMKPPASVFNYQWDKIAKAITELQQYALTEDPSGGIWQQLAAVATSGSYNDLLNKPEFKAIATSGSWNDLTDKPNIESYIAKHNAVLQTIGVTSANFSLTSSSGGKKTYKASISLPKKCFICFSSTFKASEVYYGTSVLSGMGVLAGGISCKCWTEKHAYSHSLGYKDSAYEEACINSNAVTLLDYHNVYSESSNDYTAEAVMSVTTNGITITHTAYEAAPMTSSAMTVSYLEL